jgi:hypothetical protein
MFFKVLAVAGWAAVSVISTAQAQSLAGPAENPPAGFKGSQYVDSRGCVFLRAGIGGRVNWVPRISRDRKALCGQSPAAAARDVAVVQKATPAPAPVARVAAPVAAPKQASGYVGKPMETVASLPRRAVPAAPKVAPAAVAAVQPQRTAPRGTASRNSGCPASAPYGARVTLSDGRRSLLCSADANFDVNAAASRVQVARNTPQPKVNPMPPAPAYVPKVATSANGYKCPASAPVARRYEVRGGGTTVMCTTASGGIETATPPLALAARTEVKVPKGYKKAWKDDRLNPNRAKGTARGQAQQDQVWTRDTPAEQVASAGATTTTKRRVYATSTSNAPRKVVGGRYYVQVGTFGEPANAARTAARLQGLGLPVAKSRITSKGRNLQIVMAGPFGDAGSANAALSRARRSGFGDAFIR